MAVRDGKPLPKVVPEREQYEKDYDELLLDTKRLTPLAEISVSPSTLLQAKYGFVAFADFHALKARLVDWAEGRGAEGRKRAVAGYLVHGAGGTGKTRLMIEVAAELRERGWSAGFLNPHAQSDNEDKRKRRSSALAHLINAGDDAGLMIILDYAEDRRLEVRTLALQMAEAAKRDPARPRILILLVREIGEWWDNLRSDEPLLETIFSSGRLGGTAEILITKAISEDERLALFSVARWAFSRELARVFNINEEPPSAKQLLRISSESDYDRPLAILMAALLDVCAEANAENESGIAVLLDQILRLERGHWVKVLPELSDVQRREMASGTVQVTLVGGTTARSDTVSLLTSDPYYGVPSSNTLETGVSDAVGDTVTRLSRFYGNGRGGLTRSIRDGRAGCGRA